MEYVLCASDPQYFLTKYAIIKSTDGRFIPFTLYPFQVQLLNDLRTHNLVIILKNRQIGCTWLVAGYAIHHAIFRRAANVIIVSKDEEAAGEVLDYCRFIYENLPQFLKTERDKNRETLLYFPHQSSKIRALSATSASGIGFGSASLIILDENDFHPKAEENYVEIKPMIDAGGNRQLIILSAPNRLKVTSSFKDIWRNARKGLNNFYPILLPFGVVPHHTEEWYQERKKEYTLRDLETRYFKSEKEALSVTVAGKFFDNDKLVEMTNRILSPILNYQGLDTRNGIIKIYKPPIGSVRYAAFTDPSAGVEDPFHTVVLDMQNKEEVANAHGFFPADEVALIHDTLVRHYNKAINSFYRTGYSGARFESALGNLYTPNQTFARNPDGKERIGQYGYWESAPLKRQLFGSLREGIFNLEYIIHDKDTLDEFSLIYWNPDKEEPEMPEREHDDRIVCWAGVVDLIRRMPHGKIELVTYIPKKGGGYERFKGN